MQAAAGSRRDRLYWINEAARTTLPIYTPAAALSYASYTYWQCEDDEKYAIEEMVADGGKPEDYDLLTRRAFDAAIPAWASNPKKRVPMETIKALSASRRGGPDVSMGRALFTLIGALAEYRSRIDFNISDDEDPMLFPPPLGLLWGGFKGLMPRIIDDFGEDVFNAGEHREYFASANIPADRDLSKGLQKFLRGVEPVFPILRTLETLLALITDNDLANK
jgi:PRTRC genetic system protein F